MMETVLKYLGFTVSTSQNGYEALQQAENSFLYIK
jgi:CheY-like chemotaxis protein